LDSVKHLESHQVTTSDLKVWNTGPNSDGSSLEFWKYYMNTFPREFVGFARNNTVKVWKYFFFYFTRKNKWKYFMGVETMCTDIMASCILNGVICLYMWWCFCYMSKAYIHIIWNNYTSNNVGTCPFSFVLKACPNTWLSSLCWDQNLSSDQVRNVFGFNKIFVFWSRSQDTTRSPGSWEFASVLIVFRDYIQ